MYRYLEVRPHEAHLRTEDPPPLPPGWGRVRVNACGVCGTDLHLYHGMQLPRGASYPVRPGHEVTGVLVEADGGPLEVGDQVILHPLIPCGECAACARGLEARCRTAGVQGLDRDGGLADEAIWPVERMVAAPGLKPEQAAIMADAVAAGMHGLRLAELPTGGALTLLGAGGVGTHILQLARIIDPTARLTAVIRSEATAKRLEALDIGIKLVEGLADSGRRVLRSEGPQDAVIEFGAGAEACREAMPMLTRGGRLVVGSIDDSPLDLGTSLTALATREIQVIGTHASTLDDLQAATQLAVSGELDLSASVSHRVSLENAVEAFEILEQRPPGLSRVVVIP